MKEGKRVLLPTGDHDAVLVLLLLPRLIAKIELLISQCREKVVLLPQSQCFRSLIFQSFVTFSTAFQFDVPETLERNQVIKSHASDAFSFCNSLIHSLCVLQGCLKQYERYTLPHHSRKVFV